MLLCIYVVVSCVLLFSDNPYQRSVYLSSANAVNSKIYQTSTNITSYFNLRDINEDLQRRNADLELELINMRSRIDKLEENNYALNVHPDSALQRYHFIVAHVINNNIHRRHNYITINKGALDGVKPEMGVVDQNGVVGKVDLVANHSSRIISLLNDNLRISCKVKGTQQIGSLVWHGNNSEFAYLEELPLHYTFHKGDTVVTSGFSTSFPEGVPVGIIDSEVKDYDDNFYTLKIKLSTDFSRLGVVRLIVDNMTEELKSLEPPTD